MIVSSAQIKIHIDARKDIIDSIATSDFLFNYIPQCEIHQNEASGDTHHQLVFQAGADFDFNHSESKTICTLPFTSDEHIKDAITLIDYVLEKERQKKGIYCFHGSSISIFGKAVLCVGATSGLGKTSLALYMSTTQQDSALIGDEKILIDQSFSIIGAVQKITINKDSLGAFLKKLEETYQVSIKQDVKIASSFPFPLGLIVQPLVLPESNYMEIDTFNEDKANFHVYEELSRKIRGTSRRVINFTYPLPSIDTDDIAQKRSDFSRNLATRYRFVNIKGNLDFLKTTLVELLS